MTLQEVQETLTVDRFYYFKISTGHEYLIKVVSIELVASDISTITVISIITVAGLTSHYLGTIWEGTVKTHPPLSGVIEHCFLKDFTRAQELREVPRKELPVYMEWPCICMAIIEQELRAHGLSETGL